MFVNGTQLKGIAHTFHANINGASVLKILRVSDMTGNLAENSGRVSKKFRKILDSGFAYHIQCMGGRAMLIKMLLIVEYVEKTHLEDWKNSFPASLITSFLSLQVGSDCLQFYFYAGIILRKT